MINEETMTFTIPNEQGIQTEYTILFSFVSSKTNKHYLVYTDNSLDDEGNLKVLSSIINEETDSITPVTTDEEYKLIEEKLVEYQKELAKLEK
jgi:uncharacterized protein YrzB (UPF0473 family)